MIAYNLSMDRALSCGNGEGATGKDQVPRPVGRDTELMAVKGCKVWESTLLFTFSQNVTTKKDFSSCLYSSLQKGPHGPEVQTTGHS